MEAIQLEESKEHDNNGGLLHGVAVQTGSICYVPHEPNPQSLFTDNSVTVRRDFKWSPPLRRERISSSNSNEGQQILQIDRDLPRIHSYSGPLSCDSGAFFSENSSNDGNDNVDIEPFVGASNDYFHPVNISRTEISRNVDYSSGERNELAGVHRNTNESENEHKLIIRVGDEFSAPEYKRMGSSDVLLFHPLVSIEVTGPDGDYQSSDNNSSYTDLNDVFDAPIQFSVNSNKIESDFFADQCSVASGGNKFTREAEQSNDDVTGDLHLLGLDYNIEQQRSVSTGNLIVSKDASKRLTVSHLFSRIRSRSQGDCDNMNSLSRKCSTDSAKSYLGDSNYYDSDASISSSKTSPVINMKKVSEYQAKQKSKKSGEFKQISIDYQRNRRKSYSSGPFLTVDAAGESSEFVENNLQLQSIFSKSDSRLNESPNDMKHFGQKLALRKIKYISLKNSHRMSWQDLSSDPQESVIFSPDPTYDERPIPITSISVNALEVYQYHPLADNYKRNIKNNETKSKDSTPNIAADTKSSSAINMNSNTQLKLKKSVSNIIADTSTSTTTSNSDKQLKFKNLIFNNTADSKSTSAMNSNSDKQLKSKNPTSHITVDTKSTSAKNLNLNNQFELKESITCITVDSKSTSVSNSECSELKDFTPDVTVSTSSIILNSNVQLMSKESIPALNVQENYYDAVDSIQCDTVQQQQTENRSRRKLEVLWDSFR